MQFCTGYLNQPSALYYDRRMPLHDSHLVCHHVRPALKKLHWLPVTHRIQYKAALLMSMVHENRCPVYLNESVLPASSNPTCQRSLSCTCK